MKARCVRALIRLYPERWRTEYGDELAEVLMRRPLRPAAFVNVIANAAWQQLRMQEPWLLVGVPMLLWTVSYLLLVWLAPERGLHVGGKSTLLGVAIFFGLGFWTTWRCGRGGGVAAMKVSLLATAPFLLVGLSLALEVVLFDVQRLHLLGYPQGKLDPSRFLVTGPVLPLLRAGLLGWLGGLAGKFARRRVR